MSPFSLKSLLLCSAVLSAVLLVTCKTAPPPARPEAQKQQTQEPAEARPPTSPDSTAAGQPATAPKSETGQKEADANLSESRTSATSSAKSRLEKARDDLRLSEATEKRVTSELEQLKKSENAASEDIRNYETYLERVREMVAENRQTVAKMEAAYAGHAPGKAALQSPAPEESQKLSDPTIPEENATDQVAELDRRLTASLSEFDAALLKKMEAIETESAAKMRDLAQQAAEAAKHLKETGAESETEQPEASDEGSEQGEADRSKEAKDSSAEPKSTQTEPGEADDAAVAGGQPEGSGPGPQADPGSRYSKEDDDIVARQLREAAEKETDPELKAKLWKEYEAYRKNTQP